MLNKKRAKPDLDKALDEMQKKEKLFTSVINAIFFIVVIALMMLILSILNLV